MGILIQNIMKSFTVALIGAAAAVEW